MPRARHSLPQFHSEDWHTPTGRYIREVMFGINDGLVTTIGFVAGATGSLMQTRLVLLAGIASVVAGTLAMGIGGFLRCFEIIKLLLAATAGNAMILYAGKFSDALPSP